MPRRITLWNPGPAATDAQIQTEVVEDARDIAMITGLRQPTAGYLLMSCKNRDDPPYQGAVYIDFELPPDIDADHYFRDVSDAMVAHGWREGPAPNQHMFGRNLSKDGVNAILYPDRDTPTRGVARIYGQCHDMSNHLGLKRNGPTSPTACTDRVHNEKLGLTDHRQAQLRRRFSRRARPASPGGHPSSRSTELPSTPSCECRRQGS